MARSFFDFFPTPRFLEMPATGLSITDAGVRLVEFKKQSGVLTISQSGEALFPEGSIQSGNIINPEAVVTVLKELKKQHDIEYVRSTLPEERAYLFRTKLINSPDRDLDTSIEFSIEENVPISVSEAVFDYAILSKTMGQGGEEVIDATVSVISQVVVEEYLELLNRAGLNPLHFEVESQAISKSVVPMDMHVPMLIINVGKNKVGLYIVADRCVIFSSTVTSSLPEISTYTSDIKFLSKDGSGDANPSTQIYIGLESAITEIKKIFLYWQTLAERDGKSALPIDRAIICGDEGARTGLADFFSKRLNIKVELANVWVNAFNFHEYVPDIPLEKSLGYASAVGLALPRSEN
jgi:Tfp pilus assembly PilM family ATPase